MLIDIYGVRIIRLLQAIIKSLQSLTRYLEGLQITEYKLWNTERMWDITRFMMFHFKGLFGLLIVNMFLDANENKQMEVTR